MGPIGGRHSRCVARLIKLLVPLVGEAELRIQDVLCLTPDYHPQPDAVVYRPQADDVDEDSHPPGEDALLVVEVADSSLLYDRTVKMEEYAAGGSRSTGSWTCDGTR
jgi:Uma2 family endonuclease